MINKTIASVDEAIFGVKSNMVLMFGGFGLCGIAENCINALSKTKIKNDVRPKRRTDCIASSPLPHLERIVRHDPKIQTHRLPINVRN